MYEIPPAPAVKLSVLPGQMGLLEDKDNEGGWFTFTITPVVDEHIFVLVTVTIYVPPLRRVELGINGFWILLLKLFGPDQEYEFPPEALKFS